MKMFSMQRPLPSIHCPQAIAEYRSWSSHDWWIEIIKRSDAARGFDILPRRWVVERTFAWLGRCRRLAKD